MYILAVRFSGSKFIMDLVTSNGLERTVDLRKCQAQTIHLNFVFKFKRLGGLLNSFSYSSFYFKHGTWFLF